MKKYKDFINESDNSNDIMFQIDYEHEVLNDDDGGYDFDYGGTYTDDDLDKVFLSKLDMEGDLDFIKITEVTAFYKHREDVDGTVELDTFIDMTARTNIKELKMIYCRIEYGKVQLTFRIQDESPIKSKEIKTKDLKITNNPSKELGGMYIYDDYITKYMVLYLNNLKENDLETFNKLTSIFNKSFKRIVTSEW